MVLVSTACATILHTAIRFLRERLNHPEDRELVLKSLKGRKVRTTYPDRNGFKKTFFIGGISDGGAAHTMAYGQLQRPFNISVAGHFYARHRIRLRHPYMHCVTEKLERGEKRYYPMELLELVSEGEETGVNPIYAIPEMPPAPPAGWLGPLFTEIRTERAGSSSDSDATLTNKSSSKREEEEEYDDDDSDEFGLRDRLSQSRW